MAKFEMDWKKRYKDSGYIKEIISYSKESDKFKFSDYMVPDEGQDKAGDQRWATFTLKDNASYQVKDTKTGQFYYLIVIDGVKEKVKRYKVIRHFNTDATYSTKKISKNQSTGPEYSQDKNMLEFIIENYELSIRIAEHKSKDAAVGIQATLCKLAKFNGIEGEYQIIKEEFNKGKSLEEVRNSLLKSKSNEGEGDLFSQILGGSIAS
ncbi:hypothetical protein DXT76_10850 [Halobacillus trueperi]|uniref:Uncharacterized protein n=1 Tax=Halobacillus trueperi TaxID=156205 RepID=A0A3D8VNG5_9BACI|nr:hypothetical protein [Halobacillus trueperi]RDY70875.1 hypothetical protein DXT76_10850 [Halobacillus trueperi]